MISPSKKNFKFKSAPKRPYKKFDLQKTKTHRGDFRDHKKPEPIKTKELLYKSKKVEEEQISKEELPSSSELLDNLSSVETLIDTEVSEILTKKENQPVLLGEKNIWKKKKLEEDSLVHLLILESLYAHSFSHDSCRGDLKSMGIFLNQTFLWFKENDLFFLKQNIPIKLIRRAKGLVKSITKHKEDIIADIKPFLISWSWDRLPPIRQFILITSWYLIKNSPSKNLQFRLNDAINHAKWFGDDKEYAFVNSILDKLITHHNLWIEEKGKTKEKCQ